VSAGQQRCAARGGGGVDETTGRAKHRAMRRAGPSLYTCLHRPPPSLSTLRTAAHSAPAPACCRTPLRRLPARLAHARLQAGGSPGHAARPAEGHAVGHLPGLARGGGGEGVPAQGGRGGLGWPSSCSCLQPPSPPLPPPTHSPTHPPGPCCLLLQAQAQLMLFFAADSSGVGEACRAGALRWAHWPISAWFAAWREAAREQVGRRRS
jgi:hypothetical protein